MNEVLKIRTLKGKIITLSVTRKTLSHYYGSDKFGEDVIINIDEIDSMFTIHRGEE